MEKIYRSGLIFLMVALFSCGTGEAHKSVSLGPQEFVKQLATEGERILLDVRTPGEFGERHLAGALNIDYNGADYNSRIGNLDKTQPVYVYCLSGGRSAAAAQTLTEIGFTKVYEMNGGISRWIAENHPVEAENFNPNKGMSLQELQSMIQAAQDSVVLVDFNAAWCAPCKKMKAFMPALVKECSGKLKVIYVDYDNNPQLVTAMKVASIPALMLFQNGIEMKRYAGFVPQEDLKLTISTLLKP
ncbi:MAG: thioredoxin domain-containing protein [Bacteroidetes bacterium]|nr:thioredoxin domain-containing protein [Bacteroidota bacterium]